MEPGGRFVVLEISSGLELFSGNELQADVADKTPN